MRLSRVTISTSSGPHAIDVQVASTPADQQRGLKFLEHLPANTGMLFLYRGPLEVTMWMKDTCLSLDMIFIGAGGVVHRIEAHTTPLSHAIIASEGDVVAVLELAAGSAERLGLQPGDQVTHAAFSRRRTEASG